MEVPDECCPAGSHDFGQAGRCKQCGIDRADTYPDERRTGGAGVTTAPLTDTQYRREIRKLTR